MTLFRTATLTLAAALLALGGCDEPPSPPPPPSPPSQPTRVDPGDGAPGKRRVVALLVPHDDLFWQDVKAFMEAACQQFDIELRYTVAGNSRERMKEQLREETTGPNRVDAAVFQSFKQNGEDMLRIAHEAGVPAFLFNVGVDPAKCGRPRERFTTWLGTMVSDSEDAGYQLGDILATAAKAKGLAGADGKIHMVGIGGIVSDQGSNDRIAGLRRLVEERGDIVLHQVVPTDWSLEDARIKADALLKRFPETTVVWGCSDPLALAAIDSLRALGRKPGEDAVVGGFDWTAEAVAAVADGSMHATLGGEFMAGGWVAVLLHDYFEGRDFAARQTEFATFQRPITRENAGRFQAALAGAAWEKVDFVGLANPADGEYRFDAVHTLEQLAGAD